MITPHNLWVSWSFEPTIVTSVMLLAVAYGLGLRRLWSRGRGRGISFRQSLSFAGGLAALVVALLSPLDSLATSLFSAHMVQHLLLILVAAPLLVGGSPGTAIGLALPLGARRTVRSWERKRLTATVTGTLSRPVPVLMLHVTALYLWHLPVFYQAALGDDRIHALEHASFFGTAWLFWWLVVDEKGRRKLGDGAAVLYVFLAGLASGALGALLTFAPSALYPIQGVGARAWGLTPLTDQQLAGLIMWVPAGVVYVLIAAVLFLRWMSAIDTSVTREGGAVG